MVKIEASDFTNVSLVSADSALLLCWEEKVRQGVECSLFLTHRRGKVTIVLKCSSLNSPEAKTRTASFAPSNEVMKKMKNKQRLEALLSYHQRLVD